MTSELFGPFRCYWCMPWEAFLQILKRMFSMTNYKSAPMSVAKLWSLKAARSSRVGWFEDVLIPAGELRVDLHAARQASTLVDSCIRAMGSAVLSVRMLKSVVRGPEEIKLEGWVQVASAASTTVVARIVEMVQVSLLPPHGTVIRLLCHECRPLSSQSVDDGAWAAVCG